MLKFTDVADTWLVVTKAATRRRNMLAETQLVIPGSNEWRLCTQGYDVTTETPRGCAIDVVDG
jgi:hypothetical protein